MGRWPDIRSGLTVSEDPRPVNGTLWGRWVKGGNEHWDVVRRSWSVFVRNTTELVDLLKKPTADIGLALQLVSPDPRVGTPFWEELDQRLHNQVASAGSLVDHTRPLTEYYRADTAEMVTEYESRNGRIMEMNEAAFLRNLRNYLLHYGVPPVVHTLSLGPKTRSGPTGHVVKLSAAHLLKWSQWSAQSRGYLSSFPDRDGPVLGQVVADYGNAMSELYTWLLDQRQVVNNHPNVLNRFRIE
jgi:hypothetical protein